MKAKRIKRVQSPVSNSSKQPLLNAKKRALAKKIDEHVRVIKTLIVKMEELEMQELYNGLLANVLSNSHIVEAVDKRKKVRTIPVLSADDMSMIKRISSITDELYNQMGDID